MAMDPTKRPQDAAELLAYLTRHVGNLPHSEFSQLDQNNRLKDAAQDAADQPQ